MPTIYVGIKQRNNIKIVPMNEGTFHDRYINEQRFKESVAFIRTRLRGPNKSVYYKPTKGFSYWRQ